MCGRFTLKAKPKEVQDALGLPFEPDFTPRYNIAPSQTVLAIRANIDGKPEVALLRWGLVPSWADDLSIAHRMINARSETVQEKPSFRSAFKKRRCLIVADGFYEWQKLDAKKKQPYWIHRPDEKPFAFAGLWERRERPGEEPLETCTILTTSANETLRPIHERMPVIFAKEQTSAWLADPGPDKLVAMLKPCSDKFLTTTAVSDRVNSPRNDVPACIEPALGGSLF
jgi:putative SOS response-associated peptidase YedK